MKLIRLKITDPCGFRSLQPDFEYHFRREWELDHDDDFAPFICAGSNGSGKSNLLEVLAAIFFHIECMHLNYRPAEFEYDENFNPRGFQNSISSPDAFELEYLIEHPYKKSQLQSNPNSPEAKIDCRILIIKKSRHSPEFFIMNWDQFPTLKRKSIQSRNVKFFLPENIVAYSSGENEILSLQFYKMRFIQFDEYRSILKKDDFYGQVPEGRMVFVDEHFNQSILLANYLMQDDDVLTLFNDILQLSAINRFTIIIGKHHFEKFDKDYLHSLSNEESEKRKNTEIELTSKLGSTIDKLKSCATSYYEDKDEESDASRLILDYWVNDAMKKSFRLYFSDPLALFQAFQILYTLNYCNISEHNRIRIYNSPNIFLKQDLTQLTLDDRSIFRIKELQLNKSIVKDVIYTRSLSDGEHQLLHSIGICLLYRNSKTLFLLDEPETHFNPEWRSRFITILKKCFYVDSDDSQSHEMLITTHTPFLISDSKPEKVLVFEKEEETGNVTISRPDYNTLGASINKITMNTFSKRETIGGFAESILTEIKSRFEIGNDPDQLIKEINDKLGDSIEKVLLIKTILDSIDKGNE